MMMTNLPRSKFQFTQVSVMITFLAASRRMSVSGRHLILPALFVNAVHPFGILISSVHAFSSAAASYYGPLVVFLFFVLDIYDYKIFVAINSTEKWQYHYKL